MNNQAAKKFFNIALKVVTWLLVAFTVFMMVFTIVTVSTFDKNDRNVFGYRFYIVKTDSMSLSENNKDMDVHINAGDIVVMKNVDDPTTLEAGDIIAFLSTNSDSYGETVTHMIREVKTNKDGKPVLFYFSQNAVNFQILRLDKSIKHLINPASSQESAKSARHSQYSCARLENEAPTSRGQWRSYPYPAPWRE